MNSLSPRALLLAGAVIASPFGVPVTQEDVDLNDARQVCFEHPQNTTVGGVVQKNEDFWPEPCGSIVRKWIETGASRKYDEIEKRSKAETLKSLNSLTAPAPAPK